MKIEKINPYLVIGERIKSIRCVKNMEIPTFANLINKTEAEVASIESGRMKIDIDLLSDISKALKTEINYFLTGIYNSQIVHASHALDTYLEIFKFINSLSPKQKQNFSEMLEKLRSLSSNY